ncbi:MAG: winged helix-turn-helix transcriptional regulator [Anaerolineales bacterium]|uniref:ArsR/SmtB family transcription factor n=1 Tax=Promineifilum sp. TaxID=2664178 RepID=UPI001D9A4104|nr:winged helix-turn-helix transcriptional regulator [Anaerolineales bacterium]MCB8935063.1 winged helix-turn-helix transcriptional regulator [Promineifilum sp.]MCO5181060.1 ArsR family transcriptional regulator [Promineifilum sp.]
MPLPVTDLIYPDANSQMIVALEPAHNIHHSLVLLSRTEEFSGFDEWIYRTASIMTPEERETNMLVMIGLHYATVPDGGYPSFPVYLEHLAGESPLRLRNRILDAYIKIVGDDGTGKDYDEILADVNSYLGFLRRGFGEDQFDPDVEKRAYTYLIDPPAMQQLIVGHLRAMWYKYLAVEWERVRPMLQKSVRAFESADLASMGRQEATEYVIGRPIKEECWQKMLDTAPQVIFVPSAHVGPYTKIFEGRGLIWVIFGARQPVDAGEVVPELSRAELLVRLNALADDSRLNILKLVADQGELRSQDIMNLLDISQSGASRHLQQLTAAGFLTKRPCNGAKCFTLDSDRLNATLQALSSYLSPAMDHASSAR